MASVTPNTYPKVIIYEVTEAEEIAYTVAKFASGFVGAYISNTDYNDDGEIINTLELYFGTEKDVMLFNLRDR